MSTDSAFRQTAEDAMKHTPGPWRSCKSVHGNQYRYVQIGTDKDYTTLEVKPADAYLIAAAPDLLEALQAIAKLTAPCTRGLDEMMWDMGLACDRARAAIAKARALTAAAVPSKENGE